MSDSFWATVFAIGAVQGVFLCLALLLRRNTNRAATRTLALIVAAFTLMILAGAVGESLDPRPSHLVACLNINTELAIGPLLLLFVRSILDPDRRFRRRDIVHFLPLVLGLVGWGAAWLTFSDHPGPSLAPGLRAVVPYFVFFKALVLFTYVIAAYRTLDRGVSEARRFAAGRESVGLRWLEAWIVVLAVMAGSVYATYYAGIWGIELPFDADPYGSLVLTATIYLASLMVLLRPWVLSLKPRPVEEGRWASEVARLTSYLEREQPWLEPDLGLKDLAEALGSTEKRLSAVINEGLDTSFYGLLNRSRLAEFERLARDPDLKDRTVLDLAFQAGFNSKASFYRAFREAHGTTPSAYREAV